MYNDKGDLPNMNELRGKAMTNKAQGTVQDNRTRVSGTVSAPRQERFVIGECGQEKKKWDNTLQQAAVKNFLANAKRESYDGCFIWNYGCRFKQEPEQKDKDEKYSLSLIEWNGWERPVCNSIRAFAQHL